jgi:glycosyltransferase involved in cell wall biosynthesis
VIPHGIHARDYPAREAAPARRSILFLAVLEYWKGIFTLLEAFDRVAAELQDAELEIWGDGKEKGAVEQWVARSPHRDRIHLRGRAPRERVSEIMRAHAVYCMPSYGEPFGMTLLEAMASGVPVISTDAGGPPSIVQPAGGRIVPMRDVPQLSAALIEILSRPELQDSMGAYNRRRIEQEYDWSRSLDRMEQVYAWCRARVGGIRGDLANVPAVTSGP